MLEIEYELLLDDELDAFFTTKEFNANLPLLQWHSTYIASLSCLLYSILFLFITWIWDLQLQIETSVYLLILGVIYIPQIEARSLAKLTSWASVLGIKWSWRRNPDIVKERTLVIDEQKFIFCSNKRSLLPYDIRTESYPWKRLKYFLITKKGIILEFTPKKKFFERKQRFIPRRVLTEEQLQELKNLANQHGLQLGMNKKLRS